LHILYDTILAEKPIYDVEKQKKLFKENKPDRPPKRGTEKFKMLKHFCNEVEFMIQVVAENEYQAAVTCMGPPEKTFSAAVVFPHSGTVVGFFAGKKTALIQTDKGSNCSDYVEDAIKRFPNAQFVVGIGFGFAFDSEKFKLGDVLVSEQICDFKNLKFDKHNELIDRGQRVCIVKPLKKIFCKDLTYEEEFVVSDMKRTSNVTSGQFVSLSTALENIGIRDNILASVPEAIGGDMEGGELINFQQKGKINGVIVIKGVSNYADGNIGNEWEFISSLAALRYACSKLPYYASKIRGIIDIGKCVIKGVLVCMRE
jgi:nucleoside phosphorylase